MIDPEYKLKAAARETIPAGLYFVRSGAIRPDDLIFCWTKSIWLTATSPLWNQKTCDDASDCIGVARRPGIDDPAPRRTYKTPAINAGIGVAIATPKITLQDPTGQTIAFIQGDFFAKIL